MPCGCRTAGGCLDWIWPLWTTSTCASAGVLRCVASYKLFSSYHCRCMVLLLVWMT